MDYKKKNKVEQKIIKWSKDNNIMLISGHTHRPTFANLDEDMYFNSGSCIHPEAITDIEIECGYIRLVKWIILTREDNSM